MVQDDKRNSRRMDAGATQAEQAGAPKVVQDGLDINDVRSIMKKQRKIAGLTMHLRVPPARFICAA
jgi:hypothetical protein